MNTFFSILDLDKLKENKIKILLSHAQFKEII
jgi:hypothetical protein